MKILVTGFDPFDKQEINPSFEAVKALPDRVYDAEILKLELPTVAYRSLECLREAVKKEKPEIVLCVGQAGGRGELAVEKVAINLNDFRIEDNEGNRLIDMPVFEDGENAYFSTLPVKAMVKRIREKNIPAVLSFSAGTFVCNHVLYGILYMAKKEFKNVRAGFIHIPYLPEQVNERTNCPSMELSDMVRGLIAAIEAILVNEEIKWNSEGELY